MKTFRMIGTTLLAVLMCVNFTSCSEDDDDPTEVKNENGVVISGKKLVKVECNNADADFYEFTYDDATGQLATAKVGERNDDEDDDFFRFNWIDKNHVEIIGDNEDWDLLLENGLVQFVDEDKFIYDGANKFVKAEGRYGKEFNATWSSDKLMKIEFEIDDEDREITEFTYGKTCKNGYFPFFYEWIGFDYSILFMAHPELVGMRSKQLPESITITDFYDGEDDDTVYLQYEMEDGYISKIKVGKRVFTLTWE